MVAESGTQGLCHSNDLASPALSVLVAFVEEILVLPRHEPETSSSERGVNPAVVLLVLLVEEHQVLVAAMEFHDWKHWGSENCVEEGVQAGYCLMESYYDFNSNYVLLLKLVSVAFTFFL